MKSFDPRITRANLEFKVESDKALNEHEYWETYEVFHQKKRGEQHIHVGVVHAPTPDIALLFAKEQFVRRIVKSNLWVVKS
jgi:ring-1,2-phenylacetyl-CoA epoxidase subunit PaaB